MASKRTKENAAAIDGSKAFSLKEAFDAIKGLKAAKFDETVECVARLGVDPKKSVQMVRGAVSLPHGLGKDVKVICFAEGNFADDAKEAGAAEVGGAELAEKIEGGWTDFDIVIAHPSMMRVVGRLGRVLGPFGKMPSPKSGTVTPNIKTAVSEFKAGKVEFRVDSAGNVHIPIGKASFSSDKLSDNASTFLDFIISMRPATVKGAYIRNISVSTTMGPGLKVDYSL